MAEEEKREVSQAETRIIAGKEYTVKVIPPAKNKKLGIDNVSGGGPRFKREFVRK